MYSFEYVIPAVFLIINGIYFGYIAVCLYSWRKLPESAMPGDGFHRTGVTVIIPARNEEDAIAGCLESISGQLYPRHLTEIIVADDHSTDRTKEVAEKTFLRLGIKNGKIISNGEDKQGKKSAITEAIRGSSGELMVVTDADCRSNNKWLSTLVSEYERTGAYMLCGPVYIESGRKFMQRFQSLELCGLSLLSGAGIHMRAPLLCNGANMAYTRQVFDTLEGFKGIDATPSGDDILFMFKVQRKYPGKIRYVKSCDAVVYTGAQTSPGNFISQRIRWASKGLNAKNVLNSMLSLLTFGVNFLSLAAILYIIFQSDFRNEEMFVLLIPGIGIKITADFLLLVFATDFFRQKKLLWFFPLAEIVTMIYVPCIGVAANVASYSWKGRHYKRTI